jgi:hypothetical protein
MFYASTHFASFKNATKEATFAHLQEACQVSHALHQLQNGAVAIGIGLQMRTNELKRGEAWKRTFSAQDEARVTRLLVRSH